jgi:SAM-dependent methyltransferase
MSTPAFDPLQYKALQRHEWGVSAAGWQQHWAIWERAAQHVNARLIELAHIDAGHRVLDSATELGEPAFTATRLVGPTGWVVATDVSSQMLALAQEGARVLGLHNIEFREMDAEDPDLPEHTFQAILCRWGLMFLPHLSTALSKLRRLLVPGGRFAATVWGPPECAPALSLPMGVIRQALALPPPPAGTPGAFSLADAGVLERTFTQAGFTAVHTEGLTVTLEYASVEELIQERQATSANTRVLLGKVPAAEQAAIWRTVTAAVRPYATAEGGLQIPNDALCVVDLVPLRHRISGAEREVQYCLSRGHRRILG